MKAWPLLLAALTACASPRGDDAGVAIDGSPATPTAPAAGRVSVLVFTSLECPIANAYAPTLRQLAAQWQDAPVDLFLVVADPEVSLAAVQRHAAAYQLPGRIVLDRDQRLVRTCNATMTPEAVVWTTSGATYRGRIDDAWVARGNRRPAVVHDLREAVQRTLGGDRTFAAGPPPIGCHLPTP